MVGDYVVCQYVLNVPFNDLNDLDNGFVLLSSLVSLFSMHIKKKKRTPEHPSFLGNIAGLWHRATRHGMSSPTIVAP